MLFDGFTVASQAVNFLILVWLLRRFLYAPILAAIDLREKGIQDRLAEASGSLTEALVRQEDATRQIAELGQQREEVMEKARQQARLQGEGIVEQARQAAIALAAKRREALRVEEEGLSESLARRAREEAFHIARQILLDLGGCRLNDLMVEVLLDRLAHLDGAQREALVSCLHSAGDDPVVVRSSFELASVQRQAFTQAMRLLGGSPERTPRFDVSPELLGGVELIFGGHKLSWAVSDYLSRLEASAQLAADPVSAPR